MTRYISMKLRITYCAIICSIALFISCSSWPTSFERIDHDNIRTLDFVYKNHVDTTLCEAMPGDTILLYAYFSGEPITSIRWQVSFNVFQNIYGQDTALDIQDLVFDTLTPYSQGFSDATQRVGLKFQVPATIMYTSQAVKEELFTALGLNKILVLGLLDTLSKVDPALWSTIPELQPYLPVIQENLPALLQVLSVPVRIFATVNGLYNITSDFIVRYNRHVKDLPGVVVNHNPKINYIGLYKLKDAEPVNFDATTMTERDSTYCFYYDEAIDTIPFGKNEIFSDTVLIDVGYTYHITCDSGVYNSVDQRDLGLTFDPSGGISSGPETFFTQLFFQHDKQEVADVDVDDLMVLSSNGNFMNALLPPLDTLAKQVTLWVQVWDYFLGERNRPYGSNLQEVSIYFKYTQAYVDSLEKLP